jgi:hypothetical protein
MATPLTNSPRFESSALTRILGQPRRSPTSRPDHTAKRLITGMARRIKENSVFFPAVVRGFRALQKLGLNLTPNHFYWPIPDMEELTQREWPIYAAPAGCDFRLRDQLDLAHHFRSLYVPELTWNSRPTDDTYHYNNGYFESCDAEVGYCMVRDWKPRRIIEIGSGFSTRAMAEALRVNQEQDGIIGELITVDPYPERLPVKDTTQQISVIPERVQRLDLSLFESLAGRRRYSLHRFQPRRGSR